MATLSELLQEAHAAAGTGDLAEAERLYRQVLDRSPANVEAWTGLGTVLAEPEQQAACFQKALEIDPTHAEAAAGLERLQVSLPAAEGDSLRCAFHPQVETVLRCSQCSLPICTRCAQPYPVGHLCPVCARSRRPPNYQPGALQLLAAGAVTLVAAALAAWLASFVVRWGLGLLLAILGGPMVGRLMAQAALWAGRRQRGLAVQITVALCIVVGSAIGGAGLLVYLLYGIWYPALAFFVYVALAAGSAAAWLR